GSSVQRCSPSRSCRDGDVTEEARSRGRELDRGHPTTPGGGAPPAKEWAVRARVANPDVGDREQADRTPENAVPLLRRNAGRSGEGPLGDADRFTSVQDTVRDGRPDEIMISMRSKKASKWLRRDPVRKVEGFGLPMTAVDTVPQGT